jgi:hypothetical protein
VKKYSFDGQHCLDYTRDVTIKPKPEKEEAAEDKE